MLSFVILFALWCVALCCVDWLVFVMSGLAIAVCRVSSSVWLSMIVFVFSFLALFCDFFCFFVVFSLVKEDSFYGVVLTVQSCRGHAEPLRIRRGWFQRWRWRSVGCMKRY
jgi:hypothetical protein